MIKGEDGMRRKMFLFLFIFTVFFYGYHAREFGAGAAISVMSLMSCLSIMAFLVAFFKVGDKGV